MWSGTTDCNLEKPQIFSWFSQEGTCWVLWWYRELEASQEGAVNELPVSQCFGIKVIRKEEKDREAVFARFWICVKWAEELRSKLPTGDTSGEKKAATWQDTDQSPGSVQKPSWWHERGTLSRTHCSACPWDISGLCLPERKSQAKCCLICLNSKWPFKLSA